MSVFAIDGQMQAMKGWCSGTSVLHHNLPQDPRFSLPALASLIDVLPKANYMLMHTGPVGTAKRLWIEGEIGDLKGTEVLEAIRRGNLWLLIRHVDEVSGPMRDLLGDIYREIDANVEGGYPTFNQVSDILISSPSAQVYYHFDHNGQTLWQVHGSKRVYVYPNKPPFLTTAMLEYAAVYADETSVPFDPSFDAAATIYELKPGEMIHWPLFSPHRVENLEFSVSYTTQYYTQEIRKLAKLHAANGIIHTKVPGFNLRQDTNGLIYSVKSLLQSGVRRSGLLHRLRQGKRSIQFRLDPFNLGAIRPA